MPTYRVTLEYDGTRYHGWQEQKNARSVAGEVRRAIRELVPLIELGGSGRTDAGVHALAQEAHLRLRAAIDPEPFRRSLNDLLPSDIHVLSMSRVDDSFHARHDALARSYLYQISARRTALAKRYVWWVKAPLDLDRMRSAAGSIVGRHDFGAFCERAAEQESTIVVVDDVVIARAGSLILVRLVASHFLWKMVRRLVGTLVRVGTGDVELDRFAALLAGGDVVGEERPASWTAPASGLFLERVVYAGDPPLPPPEPVLLVRTEPLRAQAPLMGSAPRSARRAPSRQRKGRNRP